MGHGNTGGSEDTNRGVIVLGIYHTTNQALGADGIGDETPTLNGGERGVGLMDKSHCPVHWYSGVSLAL